MDKFETKRLIFFRPQPENSDFYVKYLSDEMLTRYLPLERPYNMDEISDYQNKRIEHFKNYGFGVWLLSLKSTDEIIGYCGFEYANGSKYIDLRYGFLKEHHKKGFGFEAGKKAVEIAFNTFELKNIYAAVLAENKASQKLVDKLGFQPCYDVDFYGDLILYFKNMARE